MFRKKSKGRSHAKNSSIEQYQASDWLYDMYHSSTVWLNRALVGLCVLALLLAISIVTNFLLFPLKRQVPYLYAFNQATGEVTKLGELSPSQLPSNWQMSRFFLMHYVMDRESYDADNLDYPYQIAYAMTEPVLRDEYDRQVDSKNPASPYSLYGKNKYVTIHVLAVSQLSADTASVRFQKILHDRQAGTTQIAEREAIIKWHYQRKADSQKMLDRNPLSFYVTYYQSSPVSLDNPTVLPTNP
jgi:type IV secretion system protein VirB8